MVEETNIKHALLKRLEPGEDPRIRRIRCPVCWSETMIQIRKGAASLPRNDALIEGLELMNAPEKETPCTVCEDEKAEFECETQCGELCGKCNETLHARGRFRDHRVVTCQQGREAREKTCQLHEQELDVYCYSCEMVVCQHCAAVGQHKSHECLSLIEAYNKEIKAIEQVDKDQQGYIQDLRKGLKDIETCGTQIEESASRVKEKIIDYFNTLTLALDKRKNDLLSQLDKLKDYKLSKLVEQQKEIDYNYDQMHNTMVHIQAAMQRTGRRDVLKLRNHYKNRLKLVPMYPTPVDVVENPVFQHQLDKDNDVDMIKKCGHLEFAPRVTGVLFPYKTDFDSNGIMYWIGRNYGTAPHYKNPASQGLITVVASGCEYGAEANAIMHQCIADKHMTYMSNDSCGAWLEVQLGVQYCLCPTHYTVRNCPINPGHALCNWAFEGSNNGFEWDVLRDHRDDHELPAIRASTHTWEVVDCQKSYTRFRIRVTGPNQHHQQHAKFHYLLLAGMELYGYVNKLL
eukprot:TRINITY_DN113858_c0_g1_i1.p1 TRINITY_DN113858_c0_g1~~TRINITY_DN113858_c0_g1_i1.p1  ORF type:complete len:569 (-),score=29.35 TRINITY_DN113858_c0_g1_i1:74-1618(-)